MKKIFAIVLSLAMLVCFMPTMAFAAAGDKAELKLGDSTNNLTMTMDSAYKITAKTTGSLSAAPRSASMSLDMTGLKGNGIYTGTGNFDISAWGTAFSSASGTTNVTLNKDSITKSASYTLASNSATPKVTADAQALVDLLAQDMSISTGASSIKITLPSGLYIHKGTNKLTVKNGGTVTMGSQANLSLNLATVADIGKKIEMKLPAGTQLQIGTMKVALAKGYKIEINGSEVSLGLNINQSIEAMILDLVPKLITAMNGTSTVTLTADSTPTPPVPAPDPVKPDKPKEEVVTKPDGSTITTTTETDKATGAETKSKVVKDKDGQMTAKTEAKAPVKSEVTGTTATATVGKAVADKLLEQTKAAEKKVAAAGATKAESTITLDVKTAGTVSKAEVSLPADTLGKIANETSASVKIETSTGAVEFDKKALQEITKGQTTGEVKLVVEIIKPETMPQEVQDKLGENAMVVDLSIQTDAGKITDFNGGSATVSIAIPAGIDATKLGVVYIRTDGKLERVEGKVVMVNGKPVFQFVTSHFSQYAILDQATIDKLLADQNEHLVKGVKATKIKAIKTVAKKGNVTVTWKKSPGYKVDGYQVWKSAKKTSGFKKMMTTTKMSYKNTYGIKAGKTYYYKVRGVRVLDGKNIYTNWAKVRVVAK